MNVIINGQLHQPRNSNNGGKLAKCKYEWHKTNDMYVLYV